MITQKQLVAKIEAYEKDLREAIKPHGFTVDKAGWHSLAFKKKGSSDVTARLDGYGRSGYSLLHDPSYECVELLIRPRYRHRHDNQPQRFRENKKNGGKLDIAAIVAAIVKTAERYTAEDAQEAEADNASKKNARRAHALMKKAPPNANVSYDAHGIHVSVRDVTEAQACQIFEVIR